MMCDTNCLTDWADELDGNQSDFSFLSDLIAYVDDLVTAEPQLVFYYHCKPTRIMVMREAFYRIFFL